MSVSLFIILVAAHIHTYIYRYCFLIIVSGLIKVTGSVTHSPCLGVPGSSLLCDSRVDFSVIFSRYGRILGNRLARHNCRFIPRHFRFIILCSYYRSSGSHRRRTALPSITRMVPTRKNPQEILASCTFGTPATWSLGKGGGAFLSTPQYSALYGLRLAG